MTRRFAGFMAIFAFFVACVTGLLADVEVYEILLRGLAGMAIFFFMGLLVGYIANKILLDSLFGEEIREIEAAAEEEEGDRQGAAPPA